MFHKLAEEELCDFKDLHSSFLLVLSSLPITKHRLRSFSDTLGVHTLLPVADLWGPGACRSICMKQMDEDEKKIEQDQALTLHSQALPN